MRDIAPPKIVAGEVETWTVLYQFQRESLARKLVGVDEEAARHSIVPSGTSLLWIVKHCTRAERLWFLDRFVAREELPRIDVVSEMDTITSVTQAFQRQWLEIEDVVTNHDPSELAKRVDPGDKPVTLRWILGHLLEEVARHAGHADVLRELIDGQVGR